MFDADYEETVRTRMPGNAHSQDFLDAVLSGSRLRAMEVVTRAREAGLDLPQLYLEVLQPALREIGHRWEHNEISVADEHLATAITQLVMSRLYADVAQLSEEGPLAIGACAASERHEIGLRMVLDLLELRGWRTAFLGSAVPVDSLVAMARDRGARIVALSASIEPHVEQLRTAIAALRELEPRPFVMVGGRLFLDDPDRAMRIGADGVATDAMQAADLAQALVE